ncbi:uncharacterized protein ACIGJ3_001697 [Trichechus inunguis]
MTRRDSLKSLPEASRAPWSALAPRSPKLAERPSPEARPVRVWDVQPGGSAGLARAEERQAERPRQHLVQNPGPGPSPTPASSPRRRSLCRRAAKLNGAGTGAAPPASPAPSGRAERRAGPGPEAEGARRHLHRPASAQRAQASVGARAGTAPSARAGGSGDETRPGEGPGPRRSKHTGPRRRRDSAGTLLRPLPGSHSSPWAGRQALCQEPGLPTPPSPPPAGALGEGGSCGAGQPGRPASAGAESRDAVAPLPMSSTHLAQPGRGLCEPSGPTEICPEPLARAYEPQALQGRHDQTRKPVAPSRPAPPPTPVASSTDPAQGAVNSCALADRPETSETWLPGTTGDYHGRPNRGTS